MLLLLRCWLQSHVIESTDAQRASGHRASADSVDVERHVVRHCQRRVDVRRTPRIAALKLSAGSFVLYHQLEVVPVHNYASHFDALALVVCQSNLLRNRHVDCLRHQLRVVQPHHEQVLVGSRLQQRQRVLLAHVLPVAHARGNGAERLVIRRRRRTADILHATVLSVLAHGTILAVLRAAAVWNNFEVRDTALLVHQLN